MAWKVVDFAGYCKTCKNKDKAETEPPCKWCLNDTANWDSHKPTRYDENKHLTAKEKKNG